MERSVANVSRISAKRELCFGVLVQGDDWTSYVVVDGKLITGQNPQVSILQESTYWFYRNLCTSIQYSPVSSQSQIYTMLLFNLRICLMPSVLAGAF